MVKRDDLARLVLGAGRPAYIAIEFRICRHVGEVTTDWPTDQQPCARPTSTTCLHPTCGAIAPVSTRLVADLPSADTTRASA
jgi:hypothetical protein